MLIKAVDDNEEDGDKEKDFSDFNFEKFGFSKNALELFEVNKQEFLKAETEEEKQSILA
jgi:hypothetical protein